MTARLDAANAAFRDYETDGVPASGIHDVVKSEVRSVFGLFDTALSSLEGVTLPAIAQGTGIDPTGVADSTAALNALLATYKLIYFPPGTYKVTDALIVPEGCRLVGAGRFVSIIYVDTDFNMNAAGVLDLGSTTVREAQSVMDLTVRFYQNDAATNRVQVIKYPPALNISQSKRCDLVRVRVEKGYIGVWAAGNYGGLSMSRCELGCLAQYQYKKFTASISGTTLTWSSGDTPVVGDMVYSTAIGADAGTTVLGGTYITASLGSNQYTVSRSQTSASGSMYQTTAAAVFDGARDFAEIVYEAWPYGFNILAGASTLYGTIYQDGTNCGGAIGRCDGMRHSTITVFQNTIVFTANSQAAGIDKQFLSLSLDGDKSKLYNYGAPLVVEALYSSKSSAETTDSVVGSGANSKTRILNAFMEGDLSKGRLFYCTNGARLEVQGGSCIRGGIANDRVAEVDDATATGARMAFRNFRVTTPAAGTLTNSMFKQSGVSSMELVNVDFTSNGTAVGTAIEYAADHTDNQVLGCDLNGWSHVLGFSPSLGMYDLPAAIALMPQTASRNILENGMMDVWDGPTSVSIANASNAVVASRFKIVNNNTTATGTAQRVSAPSGFVGKYAMNWTVTGAVAASNVDFEQRFESFEGMRLDGKDVAFSFDIVGTTSAGTLSASVVLQVNSTTDANDFSSTLSTTTGVVISGTGARRSVIIPAASTVGLAKGGRIRIRITQNTSTGNQDITVGAFQLERAILSAGVLCASAPEFPSRAVALAAARRARRYFAPGVAYSNIACGQAISTTQAHIVLPIDQAMRAVPTLSVSAASHFNLLVGGSTNIAATAISIAAASTPQSITFVVTVASGLTAGQDVVFRTANTSSTITLSAEI